MAMGPPREDLPLPTQPPYTAFVGNLAFDLTESELEDFFSSSKVRRPSEYFTLVAQKKYRPNQLKSSKTERKNQRALAMSSLKTWKGSRMPWPEVDRSVGSCAPA